MKNWKIIAIIAATAVATAIAVVVLLQKQSSKRKLHFECAEFDEDSLDDIACGEQCNYCNEDLDAVVPEESAVQETVEELAADAGAVIEEAAETVKDAVEEVTE